MTNGRTAEQEYYIQGVTEEVSQRLVRRAETQKRLAPAPTGGN